MNVVKWLCFVILLMLAIDCVGSEDVSVRLNFSDSMFSRLSEEEKFVIGEYARAYPHVKDFYNNMRMDVTRKVFRNTASTEPRTYAPLTTPPILEREDRYEIRRNAREGGFSRTDSQIRFIQGKSSLPNVALNIDIFTPDMVYSFTKRELSNQYPSLNLKRNRDTFERTHGVVSLEFDIAPFSVGPSIMEDFLFTQPGFVQAIPNTQFFVSSVKNEDNHDRRFVEIECLFELLNDPRWKTWTIRLCRESWVVKNVFERTWSGTEYTHWKRYLRTYDGEFEGIPLLSSYQIDYGIYDPDDGETERMISRVQYDVTQIIPGPVDLSEFDVAQFLPPNVKIGEITQAQLSPARIAAIVIGIILIILGIYLKIRSIRKE